MNKWLAVAALGLLSACATTNPPSPELVAAANRPITCSDEQDCAVKWSRAVQWVVDNSAYRLQMQTLLYT